MIAKFSEIFTSNQQMESKTARQAYFLKLNFDIF